MLSVFKIGMFSNFVISFNTVFPLVVLLCLGAFLRKKGMCDEITQKQGNNIVFKALLPCLIFKNVFYTDFDTDFEPKLVIFSVGIVFVQYLLATCLALAIEKKPKTRGAIIHTVFRTNSLIFGMAILINMYGSDVLGSASISLAVIIPIVNVLAVYTLEKYRGGKVTTKNVLKGIAKNPIIVATVVALAFRIVGISEFPEFVDLSISSIAALTTPMALLFLGASVELSKIKQNSRNLVIGVSTRLVFLPAVIVSVAVLLGFRDINLATILTICGGPTAVTSYTMSVSMDSDSDLTGEMVTFTTVLSCLTLFGWIFALKQLGFL